jgi:predicted O-linked N-acetylglucosamine transferase (SPINDLY family)
MLDTFPYSGTTTTCDCLFMGTPLITLYNKNIHAQNVSASILTHCDHTELIAFSEDEYIEKVVDFYKNRHRIKEYKAKLRDDFKRAMNSSVFMKAYEGALTQMYDDYVDPPDATNVVVIEEA